jgi:sugar lactone lactonase YvrE
LHRAYFPEGLAFDRTGNLFVGDQSGHIYKFTPDGTRSTFVSVPFFDLEGIAFDAAGNLFVVRGNEGAVVEITPGGVESVFASGLGLPAGLAFDSTGNMFVADPEGGTNGAGVIFEITPNGDKSIFASGLNDPLELAFQVPEPWALLFLPVIPIAALVHRANGRRSRPERHVR